ncbi:hypothetical protein I552_2255 [Mycobacterium xenopi 3993]|nr:hypothetical protein I552_2255 [Mycobacterium xenopi 3993]
MHIDVACHRSCGFFALVQRATSDHHLVAGCCHGRRGSRPTPLLPPVTMIRTAP